LIRSFIQQKLPNAKKKKKKHWTTAAATFASFQLHLTANCTTEKRNPVPNCHKMGGQGISMIILSTAQELSQANNSGV
jgi:hypothetical protein